MSEQMWDRTQDLTLGSGRQIRIKRISLQELVLSGQIPDSLTATVAKLMSDPSMQGKPFTEMFSNPFEAVVAATELNRVTVEVAMVEPKLEKSPNYEAGEASYFDFTEAEREEILNWINQPVEALVPFPDGQTQDLESVPDEQAMDGQTE